MLKGLCRNFTASLNRRKLKATESNYPYRVVMIEPFKFIPSADSMRDNVFTRTSGKLFPEKCRRELLKFKETLESYGINVTYWKNPDQNAPESYFANHWFAALSDPYTDSKVLILFPMKNSTRQRERRMEYIKALKTEYKTVIDLTFFESSEYALEGAGSVVFDPKNRNVFMSSSQRSHEPVLNELVRYLNYTSSMTWKSVFFRSIDEKRFPVYHTSMMLALTPENAIINTAAIDPVEVERVRTALSGYEIIEIGHQGMRNFAGCALTLYSPLKNTEVVFASKKAEGLLNLNREIVYVDLDSIERIGGGSVQSLLGKLY